MRSRIALIQVLAFGCAATAGDPSKDRFDWTKSSATGNITQKLQKNIQNNVLDLSPGQIALTPSVKLSRAEVDRVRLQLTIAVEEPEQSVQFENLQGATGSFQPDGWKARDIAIGDSPHTERFVRKGTLTLNILKPNRKAAVAGEEEDKSPFEQSLAAAQEADPEWGKKWATAYKQFTTQRGQARSAVLGKFDQAISKVNSLKGLTPAARTDRRKQLEAARKTFDEEGRFPVDDGFIDIELDYYLRINKSAAPLAKRIDEVLEKAAKAKNGEMEGHGQELRAGLDAMLGGSNRLAANSVWHGELRRANGNTIPYHLYIGQKGEGGLFTGHVEDNPGVAGNWSYDIEGQTRNLGLEYKMTRSRRGDFRAVAVVGIVSGDRLIATVVQLIGSKGKPAPAIIVLKRVR